MRSTLDYQNTLPDWFWEGTVLSMDPLRGPDEQYCAGARDMLTAAMRRFPERMKAELPDLIEVAPDCVQHVVEAWEQLRSATTIAEQAAGYERLANAMSDLSTWHPHFNVETGEIRDPNAS